MTQQPSALCEKNNTDVCVALMLVVFSIARTWLFLERGLDQISIVDWHLFSWNGYLHAMHNIYQSNSWLSTMNWSNGMHELFITDVTAFRHIGYPVFLAFCKFLFGNNWLVVSFVIENSLVVYTFLKLHRHTQKYWGLNPIASFLLILLSLLWYPICRLLPDIMFSLCFVLACIHLIEGLLDHSYSSFLSASFCFCLMFILKEFTIPFFYAMCFPLLITAKYLWKRFPRILLFFFVPFISLHLAYSFWNWHRSDHYFSNIANRTALLATVGEMATEKPDILDQSLVFNTDKLRQKAKESLRPSPKDNFYSSFNRIVIGSEQSRLARGVDQFEMNSIVRNEYIRIVNQLPKYFLTFVWDNLVLTTLVFCSGIYFGLDKDVLQKDPSYLWFALKIVFLMLRSCLLAASVIMGVSALLKRENPQSIVALMLLAFLGIWILMYSLVHVEVRYLVPIQFIPSLVGLFFIQEIWKKIQLTLRTSHA